MRGRLGVVPMVVIAALMASPVTSIPSGTAREAAVLLPADRPDGSAAEGWILSGGGPLAGFFTKNADQLRNEAVRYYAAFGPLQVGFAEGAVLLTVTEASSTSMTPEERFLGRQGEGISPHESASQGVPPPSSITQIAPPSFGPFAPELALLGVIPGPNVRVNSNAASLSRAQVEPSIAANPANRLDVVAGFADAIDDFAPGVAQSTDGGRTWSAPAGGAILPTPPGFAWGNRVVAAQLAAGDSAVAWGLGNVVYFATLGFHDNRVPPNGNCASGGLYVYRSDDSGNTWTLPADKPAIPNTQTVFRDKEYLAVDANPLSPFAGNVYLVWDDDVYSGCPQNFSVNFSRRDISFAVSSDDGATWSSPVVLASSCLVAPVPAVAPNGDLYVAWFDCNAGIRQMVRRSTDGGLSFGPAVGAASALISPPNPLIGSKFHVNAAFPVIATDPTNGNNVYVTWSSDNGPSQTDVFVSRSLDGGTTWSLAPVRVNDDPLGNPRDQFFPWISVDTDGTVRVMWGDDRLDLTNPGGKLYDVFMAESTDHGASFGPNIRVTTTSLDPDFDGFGGTFIGDYWGLAASGVPVWGDTRNGNQDIFGAAASTAEPVISFATSPTSCGTITFDGATYTNGQSVQKAPGTYTVSASPCAGYVLSSLTGSGGVSVSGGSATVSSAGTVTATFTQITYTVSINTSPANLQVQVDGTTYIASYAFSCVAGSAHSLNVPSPQPAGTTRYTFASWSDGGAQSHSIACNAAAAYIASFATEYQIMVSTSPANLQVVIDGGASTAPQTFWWASGSSHTLDIPSPQGAGTTQYVFSSWSDGGTKSHSVAISDAGSFTATLVTRYQVTVDTNPTGLWVQVDGAWYRAPQVFWWDGSSTHQLNANNTQGRLNFASWSDAGARSHTVVAGGLAAYTAFYNLPAAPQGGGFLSANVFGVPAWLILAVVVVVVIGAVVASRRRRPR